MKNKPFTALDVTEQYIAVALAIDKLAHDRPVVFNYFGPSYLKKYARQIIAQGNTPLDEVLLNLRQTAQTLEDTPPFYRRTYLISQLDSLRGTINFDKHRNLLGESLIKAVKEIIGFNVLPTYNLASLRKKEHLVFKKYGYQNHEDYLLKNKNDKLFKHEKVGAKTLKQWINIFQQCTATDILPKIFHGDKAADYLKKSQVKLCRPKKGYPPCYYVYQGNSNASISLSKLHCANKLNALRTLLHELYPGHHLYYLYREALYRQKITGVETTLDLLHSADTPVNEGIAENAQLYLKSLPDELYKHIEISTVREHSCKKILYNAWYYLFVEQNMTPKKALTYLQNEGGFPRKNSQMWLNFIQNWKIYYPAYAAGIDLMAKEKLYYLYLPRSMPVILKSSGRGE